MERKTKTEKPSLCGVASIAPILKASVGSSLQTTIHAKSYTKQIEYRPLNVLGARVQVGQNSRGRVYGGPNIVRINSVTVMVISVAHRCQEILTISDTQSKKHTRQECETISSMECIIISSWLGYLSTLA